MAKQEEAETGGRDIGSDGGVADLNLGTPPPLPSESLRPPSSLARSSVKEEQVGEKANAVGADELAGASKLPAEEAMQR